MFSTSTGNSTVVVAVAGMGSCVMDGRLVGSLELGSAVDPWHAWVA